MADITNVQHVLFANQRGRPLADSAEQLYQTAKRFQQEWAALALAIPNTSDNFADGSDVDGRKRMTGAQATTLKSLADAMVTWFETGNPTRIAQIQQVTVNGQARF